VYFGLFLAGVLAGAALLPIIVLWSFIPIELTLPIIDIAQLAATVFLAFYIPLALQKYLERRRYVRELLVDHVRNLVAGVGMVNQVIRDCASNGKTDEADRMRVRTGLLTANLKMGPLEKRIRNDCGDECTASLKAFRSAYDRYYDTVSGGDLYGHGNITWELWRSQAFAFNRLEETATDLVQFLGTP
jgi:hypothetical protein